MDGFLTVSGAEMHRQRIIAFCKPNDVVCGDRDRPGLLDITFPVFAEKPFNHRPGHHVPDIFWVRSHGPDITDTRPMRNSETVFRLQDLQHVTDKRVTHDILLCKAVEQRIVLRLHVGRDLVIGVTQQELDTFA